MLDLRSAPRRLRVALSAIAGVLLFAAAPAAADTFSNPFPFAIPSGAGTQGNAFPYPSTIDVEGLQTHVQKATVTLHGFAHECSIDVDVLLVSPSGQTSLLTSDAGDCANEFPLRPGVDLTFDDDAVNQVPCLDLHSTPPRLLGGTYAPTDYSPPANGIQSTCNPSSDLDHSSPPPPGAPGPLADVFTGLTKPFGGWGHSLATFINSDPNGIWKLYVTDQYDRSVGKITGGWSLNLTTSPVPVTPPPPTAAAAAEHRAALHHERLQVQAEGAEAEGRDRRVQLIGRGQPVRRRQHEGQRQDVPLQGAQGHGGREPEDDDQVQAVEVGIEAR